MDSNDKLQGTLIDAATEREISKILYEPKESIIKIICDLRVENQMLKHENEELKKKLLKYKK